MKFVYLLLFLIMTPAMATTEPFLANPTRMWSKPNQVHEITVTGGISPLNWQALAGEINPVVDKPGVFSYQAPRRYMQDTILFRDRTGQEIQVVVDILPPLQVSPNLRHLAVNDKGYFSLQGGSGQWQVIASDILTVKRLNNQLEVTVENGTVGFYDLLVKDDVTHEEVKVQVQVYAPLEIKVLEHE
jgi:hypothetical protein